MKRTVIDMKNANEVTRTIEKMKKIPSGYDLKLSNLKELEEILFQDGFFEMAVAAFRFGFEKGRRSASKM